MRTLLLFACLASAAFAQLPDTNRSITSIVTSDVSDAFIGVGHFVTSPLRFAAKDWMIAGAVLGGTGLLMTQDRSIRERVHGEGRSSYNDDVWDIPTGMGESFGAVGISAVVYGMGLMTESKEVRVTGRLMLESIASAGLTAFTLRFCSGRSRPYTGDGPWHFRPAGWSRDFQSFPSGHATAAFALTTVLAERIGTTWSRIGFYALGGLTALARVRNDQHWSSDVALGAAIGITAGLHAVNREERKGGESALRVIPGGRGLTVVYVLP